MTLAPNFIAVGTGLEHLGFDDEVTPPWAMVPLGGKKRLGLKDGEGLKLTFRDSTAGAFIAMNELAPIANTRILELTGNRPKTVFLDAKDAKGTTLATLEITIKEQIRLATFIGFVFDKVGRTTRRGLDDALEVVRVANALLLPQANVQMFRADSGAVRLPFELPLGLPADLPEFRAPGSWMRQGRGLLPCVASRPPGPDGCMPETSPGPLKPEDFKGLVQYQILVNLVSRVDPKFDYNIFFVRGFLITSGFLTGAFTPTSSNGVEINLCLMPDSARGQTLAHELCHFLLRSNPPKAPGHGHHSAGKFDLMVDVPGPQNIKIPKHRRTQ